MNVAALLAAEYHEVPLADAWAHAVKRRVLDSEPELRETLDSNRWLQSLARPLPLDELESGRLGPLLIESTTWASIVRDATFEEEAPPARRWMEAAHTDDDRLLVYPNDPSPRATFLVYAPVRTGRRAWALQTADIDPYDGARIAEAPCTTMIEGELDEREVICVETGCPGPCGRSFIRRDGVEILECRCASLGAR